MSQLGKKVTSLNQDKSNDLFDVQRILDSMPYGVGLFDHNLKLSKWNKSFIAIFEKNDKDYSLVFFQEMIKTIKSKDLEIQNMSLSWKSDRKFIMVNFKYDTGYYAILEWNDKDFTIRLNDFM